MSEYENGYKDALKFVSAVLKRREVAALGVAGSSDIIQTDAAKDWWGARATAFCDACCWIKYELENGL